MRVLITADIHIDDYTKYNPAPKYRLNQFDRLASRIISVVKENKCEEIWLAGDITNKPVPVPDVEHKVKDFLVALSKHAKVRFIRGQHDMYGKSNMEEDNNSIINLFSEYAEYMDKKIMTRSGHTFAFMNYSRKQDLSWIPEKVDVMVGHVSIGFGQDWDRSKFKIGFFGDIHKEFEDGNCVSIGNPIQHRISDQQKGSFIILDTSTLKYKRVEVDPKNEFLRFYYTEEGVGYIPDKCAWEVKKHKKVTISSAKEIIKLENFSFSAILKKELESSGLSEIHDEVVSMASDYHPINFDYELKWLEIHNIKGIKDFTYNFEGNLMVVGRNGSGKSSFILSVFQWLTGSMKWDKLQRRDAQPCYLKGELEYQGNTIYIKRSKDSNHLKVNGKEISYKDKTEFNTVVEKYIPFIKYYHSYYFNYWVRELLREDNNHLKLRIITKFNGLDVFDEFNKVASNLLDECKDNLTSSQRLVDKAKVKIDLIKDKLSSLNVPEDFNPDELFSMESRLVEIKSYLDNAVVRAKIQSLKQEIGSVTKDECSRLIDELSKEYEDLDKWLSNYDTISSTGKSLQGKISIVKGKINTLSQNPDKCEYCGSTIDPEGNLAKLEELRTKLTELNNEYDKLREEFLSMKPRKPEVETKKSSVGSDLDHYKSLMPKFDMLDTLKECDQSDKSYTKQDYADLQEKIRIHKETSLDYNRKIEYLEELSTYETELSTARLIRDKHKSRFTKLKSYKDLVSKDGIIFESILSDLATKLSNENFQFTVRSEVVRKVKNLIVSVRYFKESEGKWKDYEDCSQGEKSLCDTYFLYKLLNGSGLIVFDEYYSHVDDDNLPLICEYLNKMDVGSIIISTHSNNMTLDANILQFPVE